MCQVVHGKTHFKSWHAKVGLAVFILSIGAPLGGVVSFRRLGLLQRLPEKLQPQIKWAHRNVSTTACCKRKCYVLSIVGYLCTTGDSRTFSLTRLAVTVSDVDS